MEQFDNTQNILCSRGCGNLASYISKSGNYCCQPSTNKCPAVIEKNRNKALERSKNNFYKNPSLRLKISLSLKNSEKKKLADFKKKKKPTPGKCEICGKDHDGSYGSGRFCSQSCSRKASSLNCDRKSINAKISETLKSKSTEEKNRAAMKAAITYKINHPDTPRSLPTRKICMCCGSEYRYKKQCLKPEICHFILTSKPSVLKTFKFNFSALGSNKVYIEFDKLKKLLYTEYMTNKLSVTEIAEKYNTDEIYLTWCLIKRFKIPLRNISDGVQLSILKGRGVIPTNSSYNRNQYHQSWHTTWDGQKVFLRSSYELDYAKELDEKKIRYEVESIRIPYYCTYKDKIVISIPDFYVPETNTVYEIKSDFTYNKQDIIDRFSTYISKGYNPILILEHKEYDFNHIPEQKLSKTILDYFD